MIMQPVDNSDSMWLIVADWLDDNEVLGGKEIRDEVVNGKKVDWEYQSRYLSGAGAGAGAGGGGVSWCVCGVLVCCVGMLWVVLYRRTEMIWNKARKCVVCGLFSKRGEVIHRQFMCEPCEANMAENLAQEHEDREWAEIQRISTQRFDNEYRM